MLSGGGPESGSRTFSGVEIRVDDVEGAQIVDLLRSHLDDLERHSPPESIHALDLAALRGRGVTMWSAWDGSDLAGCGALRAIDADHGEVKSMRTAPECRRRGVAAALLDTIIAAAVDRGLGRLSLETGSAAAFAPARRLYTRFGFVPCGPFGDYPLDPYSVFMTRRLRAPEGSRPEPSRPR